MPELCGTFRKQAAVVWRRMLKAQSLGLSLSEETLTEIVLYEIALVHQGTNDIAVSLATKPQETKHGADWEWWLIKGSIAKSFRVQAKRLFHDGRYQSLLKSTAAPYEQANKLIAAAKRDGHTPLYCFYNFNHPDGHFNAPELSCAHDYRGPSYWGCTLALPEAIMASASDRLVDLRSSMRPWHKLVCEHQNGLPSAAVHFATELREGIDPPDFGEGIIHRESPERFDPRAYERRPRMRENVRAVPSYVSRLINFDRSRASQRTFLDSSYWAEESGAPEDIGGIAVFDDRRG